jgi:hypothetical protein
MIFKTDEQIQIFLGCFYTFAVLLLALFLRLCYDEARQQGQ